MRVDRVQCIREADQWRNQNFHLGAPPPPFLSFQPSFHSTSAFLSPFSLPSLSPPSPLFVARGSGGALKLFQRVRAEPVRQTFPGVYCAKNPAPGA